MVILTILVVLVAAADVSGWPPNNGFKRPVREITLPVGTMIDRYGSRSGRFVAPYGTPLYQRSLRLLSSEPYEAYIVLAPIESVEAGHAVGWFGFLGCGLQYRLPRSVADLIADEFLGVL